MANARNVAGTPWVNGDYLTRVSSDDVPGYLGTDGAWVEGSAGLVNEPGLEDFGLLHLFLVSQGRKLPVAGFLSPPERESFADALSSALNAAKRGPARGFAPA